MDEPHFLDNAWKRKTLIPMSIWPMRYSSFMRPVALLGQRRISTMFAPICEWRGIIRAVRDHDTPALFDWLIETLSFQGISDSVASGYMAQHGTVRWSDIAEALSRNTIVPKARRVLAVLRLPIPKRVQHVL